MPDAASALASSFASTSSVSPAALGLHESGLVRAPAAVRWPCTHLDTVSFLANRGFGLVVLRPLIDGKIRELDRGVTELGGDSGHIVIVFEPCQGFLFLAGCLPRRPSDYSSGSMRSNIHNVRNDGRVPLGFDPVAVGGSSAG